MNKKRFNMHSTLYFKHFMRKGYAMFCSLGKELFICTLSVTTLTYAKANGNSVREELPGDSLGHSEVRLDDVIVTGSRAPLTALQSAKVVSVITGDDIHRAAAESINDLLKSATGVDVRQRGGFGVQTDISINGGTFDQITILLNGINISNPQTGHNAALFPVSLSDIERIEVLEGASARVFGSSAFNGAVNIVTKSDGDSNVRISAQGGSFGTFGSSMSVNVAKGVWKNRIGGGYEQSDGGTLNSDFKKRHMFYQGNMMSKYLRMMWQAGIISQDYGANTFFSAKFDNQYEEQRRYMTSVNADVLLQDNGRLVISPSAYWQRNYDHYQLIRGMEGSDNGENFHRADVYGGGLNIHFSWALGKTSFGGDIRKEHLLSTALGDMLDADRWEDIHGSARQYDHEGNRTNTSLFLEHNVIVGGLTLSAGVLANKNTGLDGRYRFYPGIDVSYRPGRQWKFYISWNKALRVPTYTDIYINNATQLGDKNLKPERNSMFRIGLRYRPNGMEATINTFYSKGKDMIDWVYESEESTRYHAMNIGKLDNMGMSTDITVNMNELLDNPLVRRIKIGYAYIHQQHETEHGIYRSLYALEYLRHKLTAQIDHHIWKKLSASWTLRWQQRMNGYHPYAKLDANLLWDGGNYDIYLKADNITSHRYYDIGQVKQPGLWIMAGGNIRFSL